MKVVVFRDAKTYDDVFEVRMGREDWDHRDQMVMERVLEGVAGHIVAEFLEEHKGEVMAALTPELVAEALRGALTVRLEKALGGTDGRP